MMPSMVGENPWKNESQIPRKEFRDLLAQALLVARRYDGTEASYEELLLKLSAYEQELSREEGQTRRLTDDEERALLEKHHPTHSDRSISNLLDMALRCAQKRIHQAVEGTEGLAESPFGYEKILAGVILPAGELLPRFPAGSEPRRRDRLKEYPRLETLLTFLQGHKIFLEDVALYRGQVDPNAVRQLSYVYVEIPRLQKGILVCNQAEEATFVVQHPVPAVELLSSTKEELLRAYPDTNRISFRDAEQWERSVVEALFDQKGPEKIVRTKINIGTREAVREKALEYFPTAERFFSDSWQEFLETYMAGRDSGTVLRIFGISDQGMTGRMIRCRIAEQLYGGQEKRVQQEKREIEIEQDPERLRQEIFKQFPHAGDILMLTNRERLKISFVGRYLGWVARQFGVSGLPTMVQKDFIDFVERVYGADDPVVRAAREAVAKKVAVEESLGSDPEKWQARIFTEFPDPTTLLSLNGEQRAELKISLAGLEKIGAIFGIKGSPINDRYAFTQLMAKVYPASSDVQAAYAREEKLFQEQLHLGKDPEKWATEIRKVYPTANDLLKLTDRERKGIHIVGRGLTRLGNIFSFSHMETYTPKGFLEFVARVYGEVPLVQSRRRKLEVKQSVEDMRAEFLRILPTPHAYFSLSKTERFKVRVFGIGLAGIASQFDIEGDVFAHRKTRLRFAEALYGADHPEVLEEERDLEEIDRIRTEYGDDPEKWRAL